MIYRPLTFFFAIVSFIVCFFITGPGFGLASALVVWYILTHRQQVFSRWPKILSIQTSTLGLLTIIVIIALNIIFLSGLGWLVQGSMGPGKY